MFERYTEKARRVIFFARYEASEFGTPFIEPEFLLLGLLREDRHVVTRWLGEGDWPAVLRADVEKLVDRGPKTPTSVDLPLSNEAKLVLARAAEEAKRLKHENIGTGHLFLGLLRQPDSNVGRMLISRGVNIKTVREALAKEPAPAFEVPGGGGGIARHQSPVEVHIVPEDTSKARQLDWRLRIPAAGETITFDDGGSKPLAYQVVSVEWKIATTPFFGKTPHLEEVLIHVRELGETTL